jgi:endonuclease/exonuclease/phosphatase family metal-dependent hydrolase
MLNRFAVIGTTLATTAMLTFAPAFAFAQGEPQAPPRELRVMSYNIKHGQTNASCTQPPRLPGQPPFPDCNLDIQASIDVIRSHNPDIVGLQEIDRFWARSAYLDEPAVMAAALGMEHYCYAANLDHPVDSHSNVPHQYGTVIISRFPILECGNTPLRRTGNNEQRGLTRALINVRGVPLQFFNTHLHTTAVDRLMQTADIAQVIDASPDGPMVLMGDFNARPTAAEMVPIFARFTDGWSVAGAATPDNPSGFTSSARLSGNPTSRIDYIFVGPGQASPDVPPPVAVASVSVPIDSQTRLAADHYPVVADIALTGSEVGIGRRAPASPQGAEREPGEDVLEPDEAGAAPCCEEGKGNDD